MSIELSTEREGRTGHVDEVVADGLYDEICGNHFHLDSIAGLERHVPALQKAHDAFHEERERLGVLFGKASQSGEYITDRLSDTHKERLQQAAKQYAAALFEVCMAFDTIREDEQRRKS